MDAEQLARITSYVQIINSTAKKAEYANLLTYVISEVYDRVLLYLNDVVLDKNLERVVARVASGIFNQTFNTVSTTLQDTAISSVSDNGQSVSYANEIKNYLASVDDTVLFAGAVKLLAPYRRINVITRNSQSGNSQNFLR
jgi:hypothetical protein